tara:strand:+ start:3824 stop:4615 length:792 start_codon:yes stop_codon:yes gene_type:complete
MRRFLGFLFERRDYVSLFLAIVVSIYLLSYSESPEVRKIQSKVNTVLTVLYQPVLWVRGISEVREENQLLREKVMQLLFLNSSLLSFKAENEELRAMLDYERVSQYELVPARIINKGIAPLISSVTIDTGSEYGIGIDYAVVGLGGVVGKTVSVGKKTSVVQLMTDYNFRISVKLEKSAATGILRWKSGETFEVWEIPKAVDVGIGERIITSGFSDIFPENFPVGLVVGVTERPEMLHKIVVADAFTDFTALQHLFVILKEAR